MFIPNSARSQTRIEITLASTCQFGIPNGEDPRNQDTPIEPKPDFCSRTREIRELEIKEATSDKWLIPDLELERTPEEILNDIKKESRRDTRDVKRVKKNIRQTNSRLRNATPKERKKLRGKLKKLRKQLADEQVEKRESLAIVKGMRQCQALFSNTCSLGERPVPCEPEGCYGSDFGENFLSNTYVGHATISPAVATVGSVITAYAVPYDKNGKVTWPTTIGEQVGEPCLNTSNQCSWRVTSTSSGWIRATIRISGPPGTGIEEVAYAVVSAK